MNIDSRYRIFFVWGMAVLLAAISFILDGSRGFNPADEGFVWHAAWRTLHGDVPLRDFLSYDAGRHYWQAAWMWLLGDGLFAMRLGDTAFQMIGLGFGLFALTRITRNCFVLFSIGLLLTLGMTPSFKLFEPALAMMIILVGVRLIEEPTHKRYLVAGVCAGLAGFIGKNLGIYAVVAMGLMTMVLAAKERRIDISKFAMFGVGILLGFMPAIVMMLIVPGFAEALWDSSVRILEIGAGNNLGLPIPWPWTLSLANIVSPASAAEMARGITYVCMVLFILVVPFLIWMKRDYKIGEFALLLSSWAVAVSFSHHAFGRAGPSHLAQGFHPFLIGMLAIGPTVTRDSARRIYYGFSGMIMFIAIMGVIIIRPFVRQHLSSPDKWTTISLGNTPVTMPATIERDIASFRQVQEYCIGKGKPFFVAPNWPAAYPILGVKAPTWDTYFMFPETAKRQEIVLSGLVAGDVRWILLSDVALDGRDERRFRNTYPLVYGWIENNYREIQVPQLPRGFRLLYRADLYPAGLPQECTDWTAQ